ncbi:hypothetical protein BTJ49_10905 [Oleiagrimonas sp. MCCC 1A03011]|nr:hypothetical protein BTJ49_10905 [Oleiagrimonas sp. MCCC 1A03011]
MDFFANGLCVHCHLVKNELSTFGDFHETTEAFWQSADKGLQSDIDTILAKNPESDHNEIVESYGWEMHLNQSRYPDLHRKALIISIYAYVEDQLNGLCQILEESLEGAISLKDLAGRGTERAFKFLSKVALFNLGEIKTMAFVKHTNLLRNALAHEGGLLPGQPNHLLNKLIADSPDLHGEPGDKVRIDSDFVRRLIETLEAFFSELDTQIQAFMKRFDAAQQHAAPDGPPSAASPLRQGPGERER